MLIRRLIAPTIITLVVFGLWIDYLFFRESPWSVTQFLAIALAVLMRIFGPMFDPALYAWVGDVIVPAIMIPCGVVLLYVSVAKAKVAMRNATPQPGEFVPLASTKTAPAPAPAPEPDLLLGPASPRVLQKPWKLGLVGKLAASFGALSLLFGVSVSVIVYTRMVGELEKEIKKRAGVFVLSLGEIAQRNMDAPGQMELNAAIEKYASSNSVAYLYVEDATGRIVAHRPRELPVFLRRDFPKSAERAIQGVETDYRGVPVYEIAVRIDDVKGGYAHLAIWRDVIEEETRRVVAPIAGSVLIILSGVTLLFAWVIWILTRPFIRLVDCASRISKGELDLEIGNTDGDEVGEISRSFDRMRSSLHAVLTRLDESNSLERSNEQG